MLNTSNILPLKHLFGLKFKATRWLVGHAKSLKKLMGANLAAAMIFGAAFPTSLTSPIDVGISLANTPLAQTTTVSDIIPDNPKLDTQSGLQLPITGYVITQGYFPWHPGVDLAIKIGTPVRPAMAGIVAKVDHSKFDYGNSIIVDHGDGISTLYAHLSKTLVNEGDKVDLNTIIGLSGSTGHSTGPHLHFEVRENGKTIDPFTVLPLRTIASQR